MFTLSGFVAVCPTYDASIQKYCLIKFGYPDGLCLACTKRFKHKINAFCYECKTPRRNSTTGNESLDSFLIKSWSNTKNVHDAYIQWVEYSSLTDVQEMTLSRHGCTRVADWLDSTTNEWTLVTLKKIGNEQNHQLFDFHQLTKEYPEILTPDNIWIIGITQEPSTRDYYLIFYHDVDELLDRFIRFSGWVKDMQYSDFDELEEIGSGGYGTVYTAKYKKYSKAGYMKETVVFKRFKNFDETPELFISEFRNHVKCATYRFLDIYGITQDPETEEWMIIMQYANNGSLLSYLVQNINQLTWKDKLQHLREIANYLYNIHNAGLVHCDLHSGNVVMHDDMREIKSFICDFSLSRSVNSHKSNSTVQGVLPFIAPEVFHTCRFTQKSDVYSFGIIMYLMATGEPPFRNREFDRGLVCDIMGGLRPSMPGSAPDEYKKLAERCCDADPDVRPDARRLNSGIGWLIDEVKNDTMWNAVYHNDVKPLSRFEKESKYSSKFLPTGNLPYPRNNYCLDSAAVTQNFGSNL